ncbi:protein MODIFYING WALL LIGNIN-1-like [Aristolochia californica]|uniref:protein MODIFYING WALL LIGNIN-1-like n=1 Tax=Aristolochia californica TaxID=171875 RepID=UPI0035DBB226
MEQKLQRRRGNVPGFVVLLLGLIAFSICAAAEFKKTKAKDIKLDGKLCSLPSSPAFGLGIVASICLFTAQIIGTTLVRTGFRFRDKDPNHNFNQSSRAKSLAVLLMLLSWTSFGFAEILVGVGASMNREQKYGDGWLDGECYVTKNGVFMGAAVLSLATVVFTLGAAFTIGRRCPQVDAGDGNKPLSKNFAG